VCHAEGPEGKTVNNSTLPILWVINPAVNRTATSQINACFRLIAATSMFFLGLAGSAHAQSQAFPKWTALLGDNSPSATPAKIVADAQGNSYVTGSVGITGGAVLDQQMVTVKYDHNGNMIWKNWIASPAKSAQGVDVALDAAGNVYALGLTYLSRDPSNASVLTGAEVVLVKYNGEGARQWVDYYRNGTFETRPGHLAVSPAGNAYVTGEEYTSAITASTTFMNVILQKYGTGGNRIWNIAPLPHLPVDDGSSVAVGLDANENIYITLLDYFVEGQPGTIQRYDPNGNFVTAFATDLSAAEAFLVDSAGNSYWAGGAASNPADAVFVKFDKTGHLDWRDDLGLGDPNTAGTTARISDIAIDASGNAFLGFDTYRDTFIGSTFMSVLKLNASGVKQWQSEYNPASSAATNHSNSEALAANAFGDVYQVGFGGIEISGIDTKLIVVKYGLAGQQLFAETLAPAGDTAAAKGVAIGGDGGLYVTGSAANTSLSEPVTQEEWVTIDYVQDAAHLTPTTLTFGNVTVGAASSAQTVTLANTAEQTLAVGAFTLSGNFVATNNCPASLAPGGTCSIQISFKPTARGAQSGSLVFRDDWQGSAVKPQTVELSGTGT
jgi:hypothetical protein